MLYREAYLAGAGGCRIGKRPTDLHQRAMELLGAEVFEEDGTIRAKADHPKGAVLCFPKKSVGATENAVLFAVGAEGATRLEHCAREPEVVHLCRFLKAMGAEITGEGEEAPRLARIILRIHDETRHAQTLIVRY